jgi:curved DNA-binding protein
VDYKDYYATLGVPRTATADEIKKAYRKLARQFHPDRNPGDTAAERRFKEINEANEVLVDPAKRKQYDQFWRRLARRRLPGGDVRENVGPSDRSASSGPLRTRRGPPGGRSPSAAPTSSPTFGSRSRTRSPVPRCACPSRPIPPATCATAPARSRARRP